MKDNMTKLTETIKKSEVLNGMIKESTRLTEKIKESEVLNGMIKESTRLTEKIKESEALNGMIKESTRLTEKIKESEVLNGMIKESTLDKLLVGKGTLDGLLAEEVEKWHFEGERNVTGRHCKNSVLINAEEKENMAPISTPEVEYFVQDSHTNKQGSVDSFGKKLGQLGEFASGIAEAMGDMVKDPLARNVEIPYAQQHLARKTEGQWSLASNRGWNSVIGGESPQVGESNLGVDDDVRKLFLELFPFDDTNVEPPQDKLEALLDELEEGNPWILRAKALCIIETVLNLEAERKTGCRGDEVPYADYFRRHSDRIEPLANHPRESVNFPAKRVMLALGLIVIESPPIATTASLPPMPIVASSACASSVAIAGLAGTSLLGELNDKAFSTMQNLQKAYYENKEKIQLQPTNFQTRGKVIVPSFSSWNPIPARSTTREHLLNAL
jgi:hypothetical protein